MKNENPNIEVIRAVVDEAKRFLLRAESAENRLIDNDESQYKQYTFKEVAALKRSALDLKQSLTTITKMVS